MGTIPVSLTMNHIPMNIPGMIQGRMGPFLIISISGLFELSSGFFNKTQVKEFFVIGLAMNDA